MDRAYKNEKLGQLGEKIVANWLSKQGKSIEFTIDPYDRQKDFLADGRKVEVKTQVPFISKKSFTFKTNQFFKCRTVDDLYVVAIQANLHACDWANKIYHITPKSFLYEEYVIQSDRRKMILIPVNQPAVTFVADIRPEDLKELLKYTNTDY